MNTKEIKLFEALRSASSRSDLTNNEVLEEWVYTLKTDKTRHKCVCGTNIDINYILQNGINNGIIRVGSTCVKKFFPDIHKLINIIKRNESYCEELHGLINHYGLTPNMLVDIAKEYGQKRSDFIEYIKNNKLFINSLFDKANPKNKWETEFIASIKKQYSYKRKLSDAQYNILVRITKN